METPLESQYDVRAHVAEKMFHHGICDTLVKKGKTVVLVTHQVHLIDRCDNVLVFDEGRIKASGNTSELRSLGIDINYLSTTLSTDVEGSGGGPNTCNGICISPVLDAAISSETATTKKDIVAKEDIDIIKKDENALMTSEERVEGIVKMSVYIYFLNIGGPLLFLFANVIAAGSVACNCYASFYLSDWGTMTTVKLIEEKYCSESGSCDAQVFTSDENVSHLNIYAMWTLIYLTFTTARTGIMVISF